MNSSDLTYYMNKIVLLLNNKFMSNVFKCKKLPQNAYQFLKMDLGELKEELVKLVKDEKCMTAPIQKLSATPKCCRVTDPSLAKHSLKARTS